MIGKEHPNDLKPGDILGIIREIEKRGVYETASKILQRIGAVFTYGVITGWSDNNPAANLSRALEKYNPSEFSYISPKELPLFMVKLEDYQGEPATTLGLKLLQHNIDLDQARQ